MPAGRDLTAFDDHGCRPVVHYAYTCAECGEERTDFESEVGRMIRLSGLPQPKVCCVCLAERSRRVREDIDLTGGRA